MEFGSVNCDIWLLGTGAALQLPRPGAAARARAAGLLLLAAQAVFALKLGFIRPEQLAVLTPLFVLIGHPGVRSRIRDTAYLLALALWTAQKYLPELAQQMLSHRPGEQHLGRLTHAIGITGFSYLALKLIHFHKDRRAGRIRGEVRPEEFLSWLLFVPSLMAGPIQRFQSWQEDRARPRELAVDIAFGVERIIRGLFRKLVLADSIYHLTIASYTPGELSLIPWPRFFASVFAYSFYLYWDFAGYSDLAVGLGRFFGIRLPENFDRPYLTRNIQVFWNHWHMSLSAWLKDYLFTPFGMFIMRKPQLRKRAFYAIFLPSAVTFSLSGLWHGATPGYVLWGILHGVGVGTVAVLGRKLKASPSAAAKWWLSSRTALFLATGINFVYVSLAWIPFALSPEKLGIVWGRIMGG